MKSKYNIVRGVCQLEKGAEGTVHWQGNFFVASPIGKQAAENKGRALGLVIQPTEDPEKAQAYCEKEDTRQAGPFYFGIKAGEKVAQQGKRTDLAELYKMVKEGKTKRQMLEAMPASVMKYHRGLEYARAILCEPEPRTEPPHVILLVGPTGCGKTKYAVQNSRGTPYFVPYREAGVMWFPDYAGNETVILDEIDKKPPPLAWLLMFLDRYAMRVRVHGDVFMNFNSPLIFMTANKPLEEWYNNFEQVVDISMVKRRITCIKSDW